MKLNSILNEQHDTPFNYREWAGVKITKVQMSSGLGGSKYGKPEHRTGNFHSVKKNKTRLKRSSVLMDGIFITDGKHTVKSGLMQMIVKVRILSAVSSSWQRTVKKVLVAILPSGKTKQAGSKAWKPELADFK